MDLNPYESPKEVEADQKKRRLALGVVFAFVALIPAGCICGGLTCYAAGVTGEMVPPAGGALGEAGWVLGIPLGLVVMGITWYLVGREILRNRN